MKNTIILIIAGLLVSTLSVTAGDKTTVVASTSDLAFFARQIGGDLVEVSFIAPPLGDIHYVEIRPSYMMKLKKADVALKIGLELDVWMDRLIDGSRNSKLAIVDCSRFIEPENVPTFKVDARHGDLHRFGNPHYWLGPQNVGAIVRAITEGLVTADPANTEQYRADSDTYLTGFENGLARLRSKAALLEGREVVFYHDSWPYFNTFTGLVAAGFMEPFPGIAPSPTHVKETIDLVNSRQIKVLAVEPYFDKRVPNKIASEGGAKLVTLYPSLGARDKNETYLQWLEGNLDVLIEAFK
ncbi:MAG: zinc ABC transporter substrate-binding protein [bacterium]|nr:zinc ABC transporter substrate-binding protein [bacterium]